jgi:DNA-binding NarL/FixJ family response regulator
LPAAIRLYEHQWPQRAARELAQLAGGEPSTWSLPVTAGEEQRLLAGGKPLGSAQGTVVVVAATAAAAGALGDACRSMGYTVFSLREPRWARAVDARTIVVWDTLGELAADPAAVRQLNLRFGRAPIVALCGFPRPDEVRRARAAGVRAVVSKPFLLADLEWQLAEVQKNAG